ncbi:hypothetical protein G4Y73_12580 [Wenzhouxiangella sp. XN201]|uniref:hypothetical protein n=1 Tax=Wenzhouxiangella sp. XN201 TaxID=2710755 RepID=UPI0013C980FC|nr:hypothetical protein [Wenzhouxiangella sp. XN201]NEZ04986.1 hypothetical protein [Wenzhouxiangella sp. XN201]
MKSILIVLAVIPFSMVQADVDCQSLFEKHLESDMELSYQEFDQTMDSGFRVLGAKGCNEEAADLIEEYIRVNSAEQRSLRWHIAQLRAMHGANAEAVRYAKSSLLDQEDFSERALRWNDYVLATIAFLEGDRKGLVRHRDKVAEGVGEHPGNELNLKLLDALIENFGADYATALEAL